MVFRDNLSKKLRLKITAPIKLFALCQILNLLSTSSLIYGSFTGEKSLRLHRRAVSLRTTSQKHANSMYIAIASYS